MPDFVPETELERVFAQSCDWDTFRLWQRACLAAKREQWSIAAALTAGLVLDYGKRHDQANALWSIQSLDSVFDRLNAEQQHSLFRVCQSILQRLREGEVDDDDHTLKQIRRLMCRVFFRGKVRGVRHLEEQRVLDRLFVERDWLLKIGEMWNIPLGEPSSTEAFFNTDYRAPATEQEYKFPPFRRQWTSRDQSSSGEVKELPDKEAFSYLENREALTTTRKAEIFKKLEANLTEATTHHGIKSTEATQALVRLADFAGKTKIFPVEIYLMELASVLEDDAVEIHSYDLRRIYHLTSVLTHDPKLLSLAEKLQTAVVSRKLATVGNDMSMTLPFTRLIELWNATERLPEGKAFCKSLLDWIAESFAENELIHLQVKSVYDRVCQMNSDTVKTPVTRLSFDASEEADEFVVMLATIAFHHMQSSNFHAAESVMLEMLNYYSDCIDDCSDRVGEMLWLLTETDLRDLELFRNRLVDIAVRKIKDKRALSRHRMHFTRMLSCLDEEWKVHEAIAHADGLRRDFVGLERVHAERRRRYVNRGAPQRTCDKAEREFARLFDLPALSRTDLILLNDLGDDLSDYYLHCGRSKEAIELLQELLKIPSQTVDDTTKIMTRLARLHVAEKNIADATAILFLAFNIPEPNEYDPENEPIVAA